MTSQRVLFPSIVAVFLLGCGESEPAAGDRHQPPAPDQPPAISPECDTTKTKGPFDTCMAQTEQGGCESHGGWWIEFDTRTHCSCPTFQEKCVCRKGADCLSGECLGPKGPECFKSKTGHCSARAPILRGCACSVDSKEGNSMVCRD